jgi:hypothetical protein
MATAPDIGTLYAYESQILPAWVQILNSRGVNAFVEFSDATKTTPYVDVFLDHVLPQGHQHSHFDGRLYWDAWIGWLVHRVYTQRGKNSDQQAPILKTIRISALDFADDLDDTTLPYHDILMMKESPSHGGGLRQGVDHSSNLDWSELPLNIQFCVRPNSWP